MRFPRQRRRQIFVITSRTERNPVGRWIKEGELAPSAIRAFNLAHEPFGLRLPGRTCPGYPYTEITRNRPLAEIRSLLFKMKSCARIPPFYCCLLCPRNHPTLFSPPLHRFRIFPAGPLNSPFLESLKFGSRAPELDKRSTFMVESAEFPEIGDVYDNDSVTRNPGDESTGKKI